MRVRELLQRLLPYRPYVTTLLAIALIVFFLPEAKTNRSTVKEVVGPAQSSQEGDSSGAADATNAGSESVSRAPGSAQAAGTSVAASHKPAISPTEANVVGIGSPQALAGPNCDSKRGKVAIPWHWSPPCVKSWSAGANNGGATAQGVSGNSIKVVYVGNPEQQPSDCQTDWCQAVDSAKIFQRFYQTWGRQVDLVRFVRSGTDEASERADAVQVAAMKPFAVLSEFSGKVFLSELARRKIVVWGYQGDKELTRAHAPYWYGMAVDVDSGMLQIAEFLGKGVVGRPAKWAGDEAMRTKTRKFGVVLPNTVDAKVFTDGLARYGVNALVIKYDYSKAAGITGDPSSYQQEAPVIISRLKDANVSTVVAFTDLLLTGSLTKQATAQAYNPEWVVTAFQFQDVDLFGRAYDTQQWQHAFGVAQVEPREENVVGPPPYRLYYWYWPADRPNMGRNGVPLHLMSQFFAGVHVAGPRLTPQSFRDALFALPPAGGAACGCVAWPQMSFGRHGYYPWEDYMSWDDFAMVWWSATAQGLSNSGVDIDGVGKYMYVNGGKRYVPGRWPTGEPPMFNPSKATRAYNGIAPTDRFPNYSCTGCPSKGGG